jgi:hypothetical protein
MFSRRASANANAAGGRPKIQELLLALEQMKMLMSELELLQLFPE